MSKFVSAIAGRLALPLAIVASAALLPPANGAAANLEFPAAPADGTLFNALYRPDGGGPFPAVVLLHTCAGVQKFEFTWAEQLKSWGYVVAVIDSFKPRNVPFVCGTWNVSVAEVASDAYAALDRLRAMPFVDPKRIGAMGFSYGAWATTWIAGDRFAARAHPGKENFAAALALYPICMQHEATERKPPDGLAADISTPLKILIGSDDTETPSRYCESDVKHLAALGKPVSMVVIPDATHAFDNPDYVKPFKPRHSPGTIYLYNQAATELAGKLTREFFAKYLGGSP